MKPSIHSLYKGYFQVLVNGLRSTYGDGPPDPKDIAQQAFEKLCSLGENHSVKKPESYLWVCARNILLSEKRADKVRQNSQSNVEATYYSFEFSEQEPERICLAREHLDLVRTVLEGMPARRRDAFVLNRLHGLTPEKAGKKLGISRNATVRHIGIATELIAEALTQKSEDLKEGNQL